MAPIIVFGWVICVLAALVLVAGVIGAGILLAAAGRNRGFESIGVSLGAVVVSAVVLLQAACVLAVGYYIRARSQWTRFAIGSALSED